MFPSVLFHVLLLLFCLYYFRGQNPILTTCPNFGDHLKEQNLDKALNIFIRINSGGEPLDFSDLLMSIAIANWTKKDARKEINQLIDEIRDKGFFISKELILKTFLVLYSADIRFRVGLPPENRAILNARLL